MLLLLNESFISVKYLAHTRHEMIMKVSLKVASVLVDWWLRVLNLLSDARKIRDGK